MMQLPVKKITFLGLFICIGLILGYLESLIVIPVGVPGVKLGISNIITVITLYLFGPIFSLITLFGRIFLSNLLFGSASSFIYSFSGAIVSFGGMFLLKKCSVFSVYGVSIMGGVLHNLAQLLVASLLVRVPYIFYYLPVLIIAGLAAGCFVGFVSQLLIKRLDRFFLNLNKGSN